MTLIEWKDYYSTGNDAVDHEHRELIDLINQVHGELVKGSGEVTVAGFLGEIYKAISLHFALEERFMRDHLYDQLNQHKAAHEQLLDDLRDIMDGYEADPEGSSARLAQELDSWFTVHFKTHDARLHNRLGTHDHH